MRTGYVVGLDVGATECRAVAVDVTGARLGDGLTDGANPNSHPLPDVVDRLGRAVGQAVSGLDPAACRAVVAGLAGTSRLLDRPVGDAVHAALLAPGMRCPVDVRPDAEVAFAAGTAHQDGVVLIAGTGSIAARITGRRITGTSGGYGWLLGDEGSGFWLGREAVRATLRTLQSGAQPGPLARAVLAEAGACGYPELITSVNRDRPVLLSRFAPLITACAADPVAVDIVERAATALADLVNRLDRTGPLVTAGSVATPGTPVGDRLAELLGPRDVAHTPDGAAGAAWLAALSAFGSAPHPRAGAGSPGDRRAANGAAPRR